MKGTRLSCGQKDLTRQFRDGHSLKTSSLSLCETYLGPAAVQALNVGTRLPQIGCVVEDLFVATARLVLHVIQRADFALGLDVNLLRGNLEKKEEQRNSY